MTGRASDTKHTKEKSVQTLFEVFEANNCYLANSAAMALYSTGRTNGLVIKSGERLTRAVPVFEGHVIEHAVSSTEYAGRHLTWEFQRLLLQDDKTHED